MLEIKQFSKSYKGGKKAVDKLSLTIGAGEIYGFIGHNGAGKSTTIKAVVGVLDFEEGEIYIDGMSVRRQPLECKRVTAYIPDNPDLYGHLTGIQYLNFIADIFEVGRAERQEDSALWRRFRDHRRSGRCDFLLFPRHEAKAGHPFCAASPA